MNTKNILIGVVGVVLIAAAYLVGKASVPSVQVAGTSVAGTTFSSAKVAQINFSPLTATATTTSVFNSDDNNRYIKSAFAYCTGVGTSFTSSGGAVASLTFQVATTTTSAPAVVSNTNLAANLTIATATPFFSLSSTTNPGGVLAVWPPATYLTFIANATNTAACTVGVDYAAS